MQVDPGWFTKGAGLVGLILYIIYKEWLVKVLHKDDSSNGNGNGKGLPASWKIDIRQAVKDAVSEGITPELRIQTTVLTNQTTVLDGIRDDLRALLTKR